MLEVNKINVFYGPIQALFDVSIKVNKGEIVAIIGANGSGKSTLLATISNLIHPSSGSITFLNERIDKLSSYDVVKRGIVQVMEGRRLFPRMTVIENLEMGAYLPEFWNRRKETLEQIYQLFPILKERRNQLAGTLSGGEQQMLAIARALMSKPKLLMLDEPSQGLAPTFVQKIFNLIKDLNSKEGITILIVEQNVADALNLADRAYVIENGRVALEGYAKELQDNITVKQSYLGL